MDMDTQHYSFLFLTGLCVLIPCHPLQYHFINTPLSWLNAQKYCRSQFRDLATVFDVEDMNLLVNTAQDSSGGFTARAWIGLYDNLTSWRWSFTNSNYYQGYGMNYRQWDFGQPDNLFGDQMCVRMWSRGKWEDSNCFLRNSFICYDDTARDDKRFTFVAQEMSWPDAQQYCRRHYTDLASIRNQDENNQIQYLANNMGVWIGLYRTRDWSDGRDSKFRYWAIGQPDNFQESQNCVTTHLGNAGRWSDDYCSAQLAFVCYKEDERSGTIPVSSTTAVTPDKITSAKAAQVLTASKQLEHVIHLEVTFTSKELISEENVKELVDAEFHQRLVEMGLPENIKLSLKKIEKVT
uniref:Macrophage mannose receptor 1-like n=2 Tax=Cynoglossus semilaevis TaxID=244447 RepID=A0A3P8WIG5_CYNSE